MNLYYVETRTTFDVMNHWGYIIAPDVNAVKEHYQKYPNTQLISMILCDMQEVTEITAVINYRPKFTERGWNYEDLN